MTMPLEFTDKSEKALDDWYTKSNADIRKEKISKNSFDIIKI